jgi:hypothetical protein
MFEIVEAAVDVLQMDLVYSNLLSADTRITLSSPSIRIRSKADRTDQETSMSIQESIYFMASEYLSESTSVEPPSHPFEDEIKLLIDHLTDLLKNMSFQIEDLTVILQSNDDLDALELRIGSISRLPKQYKQLEDGTGRVFLLDSIALSSIRLAFLSANAANQLVDVPSTTLELYYEQESFDMAEAGANWPKSTVSGLITQLFSAKNSVYVHAKLEGKIRISLDANSFISMLQKAPHFNPSASRASLNKPLSFPFLVSSDQILIDFALLDGYRFSAVLCDTRILLFEKIRRLEMGTLEAAMSNFSGILFALNQIIT